MTAKAGKRGVIAWCFYDWANSPFSAVVTSFIIAAWFANGVAADPISGQSQWAFMQGLAALAIGLSAPFIGAIADNAGARKPWLFWLTLIMSLACAALWFAEPKSAANTNGGAGGVTVVLWAVAIATIASELAIVFYNAMLPRLVGESYVGRVSGWAWALGYVGGLTALILLLFGFIQVDTPPFGLDKAADEHVRISGPVVALWTILFTVPLLLWTPDRKTPSMPMGQAVRAGLSQLWRTIVEVRKYKQVWRFLVARLLYIDGINTIFVMGGLYAATVFGLKLEEVLMLGIAINVAAGIGAFGFAWLDDRFGAKPTILLGIAGILVIGIPLTLIESKMLFWILATAFGLFFGPVQAASRSLMARMAPPEMEAEMFGLYAFSGKATAFLGPWLFFVVLEATGSARLSIASALPFILIGGLILWLAVDTRRTAPDTVA